MSIAYVSLVPRGPRRLRVAFSAALGAGAYSPVWFSVEQLDDVGASPGSVVAALVVPNSPNVVELCLDADLGPGALYRLTIAAGVPAADLSTAAGATAQFRTGAPAAAPSAQLRPDDVLARLFGVDLLHDGLDFTEDANGDLATITGPDNGRAAIRRRAESNGLAWRDDYGVRGRAWADAPVSSLPGLRGRAERQFRADDRVSKCTVEVPTQEDSEQPVIRAKIVFVGGYQDDIHAPIG